MNIRNCIKKKLSEKNITPYRMCKDLDINNSNIYGVLDGKTGLSISSLEKILVYLDIKIG